MKKEYKYWFIYKIENLKNNKKYIGQSVQPYKRWSIHLRDSKNPKYPIHFAISKYGIENFSFQIIATCKNQEDANWAEEEVIKCNKSLVREHGYNISLGGSVAKKSEEWKIAFKNWRNSLSEDDKNEIKKSNQ